MLSKGISVSEQVNELDDFAALLFSWLIPHADDYGIIHGSAKKIKALVVPMRKNTSEQVEKALSSIQKTGLVWRYFYKDEQYLQFCRWECHQEGLHKRTEPKNPCYGKVKDDFENFREIPGNSPLIEPKRIEEKGIEENRNVPSGSRKDVVEVADTVYLTPSEYKTLYQEFSDSGVKRIIEILDAYKTNTPKKYREYRNDYKVIRSWVIDRYWQEIKAGSGQKGKTDGSIEGARQFMAEQEAKQNASRNGDAIIHRRESELSPAAYGD